MTIYELKDHRPTPANPDDAALEAAKAAHPSNMSGEQTLVADIREELDGYMVTLRQLNRQAPGEVMRTLSSISSRLTELRARLWRSESRRFAALRSHEVEPLLDECDRQFRIHSRMQSITQMDWDMAKGQ